MRRIWIVFLALVAWGMGTGASHGAAALPDLTDPAVQDTRWLPWVGCWDGASDSGLADEGFLVCFSLLPNDGGVEIVTYSEGVVTARETLRADGAAVAIEEGGCTGTRQARWSSDDRRVLLESTMDCGVGVTRSARGMLSVLPEGRGWAEIHAVHAGGETPIVGIRTFTPSHPGDLIAWGIANPVAGQELAAQTARTQAGRSLSIDAVVEISDHAGAAVAGTLIAERGEPFRLDASTLRAMAAQGVPSEVLDVMVAVTWPERFAITGGAGDPQATPRPAEPQVRSTAERAVAPWPGPSGGVVYRGYSPWGYSYYDSYRYGYGYSYGYGYGRGGLGSRWDYPGYPHFTGPSVIVIERPQVEARSSILSRERGAVTGGGSGGPAPMPASNASPRPATSRSTPPANTPGTSASPPAATSGGSTTSPQGGSTSGNAPEERRAVPRTGN